MKFALATVGALLLATGGAGCSTAYAADVKAEPKAQTETKDLAKAEADTKAAEKRLEEARKRLEEAAREVAELSGQMATERMPDKMVFLNRNPNRAALGIVIGTQPANESGVSVMSVSPGGPADTAGLKSGDVIVELNGKSMKQDKDDSPHDKLLDAMAKLSPGEEVTLKYTREGKASIVKLKADKLPQVARREMIIRGAPGAPGEVRRFEFDGFDNLPHLENFADLPHFVNVSRARSFGDLELVSLTPKLAPYFGIDKGLLVVRAPENKELKLEDGDVLIDIDGRVPTNPGHAFRILGSYQAGEKVTLNVQRQRKKTALAVTVPEASERAPRAPQPPRPPRDPRPATAPVPAPAPMPAVPPV